MTEQLMQRAKYDKSETPEQRAKEEAEVDQMMDELEEDEIEESSNLLVAQLEKEIGPL